MSAVGIIGLQAGEDVNFDCPGRSVTPRTAPSSPSPSRGLRYWTFDPR
jgi:hypothetical protein